MVTGPTGATLQANPLSSSGDLSAFAVPGSNTLPLILDGAKRDRAVWEGDLSVTGPTLLYSSDATVYLKDSLLLLGSYQLQSGFVEGVLAPSTPVNTGGLLPGTVGTYSATYSMYFVTNLADSYRYTGDQAFVRQEWPGRMGWSIRCARRAGAAPAASRGLVSGGGDDGSGAYGCTGIYDR